MKTSLERKAKPYKGIGMEGMIVTGVQDDQITWARLYMEPVEQGGADIDEIGDGEEGVG